MSNQLAFIDTETCGLDPDRNPIWDIAVIVDDVEHVWQQRIPEGLDIVEDGAEPPTDRPYLSQWVLDNTGFRERYNHETALTPHDSIRRFAELVDGRHLVGAVPSFDEERIRRLYRQWVDISATRFPWHYHLIDVEALMVGYLCGRSVNDGYTAIDLPWKSTDLSIAVGVDPADFEPKHTALADARWAKAIYEAVVS